MNEKGFNARVIIRHNEFNIGDEVYIKVAAVRFSTPTLYAILDRKTGVKKSFIDANELKNRFQIL